MNRGDQMATTLAMLRVEMFAALQLTDRPDGAQHRAEFIELVRDIVACVPPDELNLMSIALAAAAEVRNDIGAALSPAARNLLRAAWLWYRSRDQMGPRGELRLAAAAYDADAVARRALAKIEAATLDVNPESVGAVDSKEG